MLESQSRVRQYTGAGGTVVCLVYEASTKGC